MRGFQVSSSGESRKGLLPGRTVAPELILQHPVVFLPSCRVPQASRVLSCFHCSGPLQKFFWTIDVHFLKVMVEMQGELKPWDHFHHTVTAYWPPSGSTLLWTPFSGCIAHVDPSSFLLLSTISPTVEVSWFGFPSLPHCSSSRWQTGSRSSAVTCHMFITFQQFTCVELKPHTSLPWHNSVNSSLVTTW